MVAKEMTRYRESFADSGTVYVDQFSLIAFFAHHERWHWRSVDERSYEVVSGDRRIVVLRDHHWNVNFLDERFYRDLAARLAYSNRDSTTVFALRVPVPATPLSPIERDAFRQRVRTLAARQGLKTTHLALEGWNVLGQFTR